MPDRVFEAALLPLWPLAFIVANRMSPGCPAEIVVWALQDLLAPGVLRRQLQLVHHSAEFWDRWGFDLSHHIAAMALHRGFGDAISPAICFFSRPSTTLINIACPRGVSSSIAPWRTEGLFILAARTVASEPNIYSIQKILVRNGFVKNSMAPAFMACTSLGCRHVPYETIGFSFAAANRAEIQSAPPPASPSRTRQVGLSAGSDPRKSAIDANRQGCRPAERNSGPRDREFQDRRRSRLRTQWNPARLSLGIEARRKSASVLLHLRCRPNSILVP